MASQVHDGHEARSELDLAGEGSGVLGGVGRAVVGEDPHRMGRMDASDASFDGFEHHVLHVRAADPSTSHGAT